MNPFQVPDKSYQNVILRGQNSWKHIPSITPWVFKYFCVVINLGLRILLAQSAELLSRSVLKWWKWLMFVLGRNYWWGMRVLVSFIFSAAPRTAPPPPPPRCPVHPLPPTGPRHRAIFHLATGGGEPVNYKLKPSIWISIFWSADQFNLFKGSPPRWRLLILISGAEAQH